MSSFDEDDERPTGWRRWAPAAGILTVVIAICALIFVAVSGTSKTKRKPAQEVVKLRLVQPPPPPPPKIEPQRMKQDFKPLETPPEQQAPAPPGPPALDAAGEGPGDSFGLAGRPGGGDYLGSGGGGGGSPFAYYAAMIQQRAQQAVEKQRKLRESKFKVTVQVWIAADGSTQRVEVYKSTGDQELDRLVEESLSAMSRLTENPPKGMPQPVVLRVSAS